MHISKTSLDKQNQVKKEKQVAITFRVYPHQKRAFKRLQSRVKSELDIDMSMTSFLKHCMRNASSIEFLFDIGYISFQEYQTALLFPKKNKKYPRAKNLKAVS